MPTLTNNPNSDTIWGVDHPYNFIMDLPIDDSELKCIIDALKLGGNTSLHNKLKLVLELRESDLPYKKILREQYGYAV